MNKRESIILICAGVALLYGGYEFLIQERSAPPSSSQRLAEVKTFKTQAIQRITKLNKNSRTADLAAILKQEWTSDPFLNVKEGEKDSLPLTTPAFFYSGFISMGSISLAVIDGKEYGIGEELAAPGYFLHEVTPDQVTILGPGKRFLVTVPFQERPTEDSNSTDTENATEILPGPLKLLSTVRKKS